ncbi:hypothetical protein ACR6C2_43170 [Streptomyces sp. INA 01156]
MSGDDVLVRPRRQRLGWFAMSVGMILFWALIITAVVLLLRAVNSPHEHTHTLATPTPTPEDILRERLARGRSTRRSTGVV